MPDTVRAVEAADKIVALVDSEIKNAAELLQTQGSVLDELDAHVCDYYGLDSAETALIQDTINYILLSSPPLYIAFQCAPRMLKRSIWRPRSSSRR